MLSAGTRSNSTSAGQGPRTRIGTARARNCASGSLGKRSRSAVLGPRRDQSSLQILGKRAFEIDALARHRVVEADSPGVQELALKAVPAAVPILGIACHG